MSAHSTGNELVDLSGWWRAHESDPDLAKTFTEPDAPDATWSNVQVPHHWRSEPEFANSDGPVLYRRRFECAPLPQETRAFLELDGVYYYGDVWLDGEYLGATEGSFVRHAFEIGDALAARAEHVLAIEVASPPQKDAGAQRTITAPYWQSPLIDSECNPGGLWQPVRVVRTGPVRIKNARVLCVEASVERGRLECSLTLDAGAAPCEARLHAFVRNPAGGVMLEALREVVLAAGTNELSWMLAVDEPPRWWPRALGPQHMCTLELTVEVGGAPSDARSFRTAFREVRRQRWQCSINGEVMYLKGACYGPARALPGDADDALVRADVDRALDANLDFLRVYTHIAPDALYGAADDAGLLLWQDFPMHGGYARGIRKQATRQARHMVSRLGHHPSVLLWSAHDAPLGDDTAAQLIAGATAPTWGKEVLDRSVARAIGRVDGTRPVLRNSGAGDDTHAWFGWRHGDLDGLASAARMVPRVAGFVSAFGAQSVPPNAQWMHPEQWPGLDWETLATHHGMERSAFDEHVPATDAKTFDEWREATQAYQAALLQLQIEDLRRCKGAPSGGFAVFSFADAMPLVGFGVLDHERAPKPAFATLRDACRPVLPMVDPRTGNVHVVNDSRVVLEGAQIEVTIDGRARRWTGNVEAAGIAFIGRIDIGDAIDVEAVLVHPGAGEIANRYPLILLEAGRR